MKSLLIIIGSVLLSAAIVLSFVSSNNGKQMLAKQDMVVMRYVNQSDNSLGNGDINSALKYAKLAIQANPKSEKGYICYTNAMQAKYKPAKTQNTVTAPATSAQPQPEPAKSDQGSSMGC